jgi:hypothetical protein
VNPSGELTPVTIKAPGSQASRIVLTGDPPLSAGGENATLKLASPGVTTTPVGAEAIDTGVAITSTDAALGPTAANVRTLQV